MRAARQRRSAHPRNKSPSPACGGGVGERVPVSSGSGRGGRIALRRTRLAVLACVILLAACAPLPLRPPADAGPREHTAYVVSNGWHTGIVLRRNDLGPGRVPEAADFPRAAWLEFGWGDREYYPARRTTPGMALAAALAPSPAVMHMAARDAPPRTRPGALEVVAVRLSTAGLDRLAAGIHASFDRPPGGRAESVAPGLYRHSLFYPARGRFHLFNTCNSWTARRLYAAGVAIDPAGVLTAGDLMGRLEESEGVARR